MKVCFPTQDSEGLKAQLYGHFGSAPYFTIIDSETNDVETISNFNDHHKHGQCSPLETIGKQNIGAVICRGMGRRAVQALADAGICVYIGEGPTVEKDLQKFKEKQLTELSVESACQGHGHHAH